ncbi:type I polyketide synthase [Streptomyces sp. NPDC049555]|uniref:type I polyketide synthase n=1 Tax=Streptomyces sp. NPDC049555 TaxID=3154930 RepID=UPI00342F22FC
MALQHDGDDTPIAIIGIGCRFPGGADSPQRLWQLLVEGRDTVGTVPTSRWDAERLKSYQHPDDADRYARGCFLDGDIWAWEPAALSVSPREGLVMDPQHRLATEVAWEAVEHAGIPVERMRGSRTGVYLGTFAPDSLLRAARPVRDWIDGYYIFGNFAGNAPGRIAFAMDLRGPAMAIETLCSSGLVAVHQACRALASGECDMALAGAVLLMSSPETMHNEAQWLTSQRGRCFAFDERADGYVRGEGAGMLLFKRLDDAVADGDRVLAVVRGSALSGDGQSERMTAPSTLMQQESYRTALALGRVDAGDVGLVEAHGPGTAAGDPIEYTSVNAVYGRGRGRCALGSVKTNIGHSEPTSGVAGLIKAVLAVQHGVVPGNLHFRRWHPSIPVDPESRLFVPTKTMPWPVPEGPRLAAVSSYGLAGTNAHVVIEQPPERTRVPAARTSPAPTAREELRLFVLSTFSAPALPRAAERLANWIEEHPEVPAADVAHTLAVRRTPSNERLAVPATSRDQLVERLRAFAAGRQDEVVTGRPVLAPQEPGPVFIFTGQGSQWAGMGQRLLDRDAAFTAVIDELEPLMAQEAGFSLREVLRRGEELDAVDRVQPVLFALQVALAAVWRSWGIMPAAVIGQSMGEVAAAVVAGGLSLRDGTAVICRRARLLRAATGGAMASVVLDAERVRGDLAETGAERVAVAVYAAPDSTVISGDRAQVEALVSAWQERGESASLVAVDYASHCAEMDPLLEPVREGLIDLAPAAPKLRFYTTAAPDPHTDVTLDGRYWAANLREPVRFTQAVAAALADGHRLFIECTPHPLAVRGVQSVARRQGADGVVALSTLRRDTDDRQALLTQLAAAHCAGAPVDWAAHYRGVLADLPTATWHRTHHRFDPPYELVAPGLVGAEQHSLLGGHVHDPDQAGRHLWQTPIGPGRVPWLEDHQVAGTPVMAGAAFCEMMLSAAAEIFGTDRVSVDDLRLRSPLPLVPEPVVSVRAVLDDKGTRARIEIGSGTSDTWTVHAQGAIHVTDPDAPLPDSTPEPGPGQWGTVAPADLYSYFRERHQVVHGPAFRGLEQIRLHTERHEAVVRLRIPDQARRSSWMMRIHPALLDSVVQAAVSVWRGHHQLEAGPVVVAGFDHVQLYGPTGGVRNARIELTEANGTACAADAVLWGDDGRPAARLQGLRITNITPPEQRFASRLAHLAYEEQPVPPQRTPTGRHAIVAQPGPWSKKLAAALAQRDVPCTLVPLPATGTLPDLTGSLDEGAGTTVVYAIDSHGEHPEHTARQHVGQVTALVRALSATDRPPRLWVAVQGTDQLPAAALRGLLRTAAYEHPALRASLVEVDPAAGPEAAVTELLADDTTIREVAWHGAARRLARLRTTPPPSGTPAPILRKGGAYLITGAFTGLGLLTARHLAEQSAGRLVLCGRREPDARTTTELDALRALGTDLRIVRGDIANPTTIDAALTAATADGTVLRGVVHSAGVVEDALLDNLDAELLDRIWRGKATGGWLLDQATRKHPLDFFVAYSSLAGLLGSPGQAGYAAANTFLDGLIARRRAEGLPGTAVQWGAWAQVGAGQNMADRGFAMISPADGIDALQRILDTDYGHISYSPIDLDQWLAPYPHAARSALFAGTARTADDNGAVLVDDLLAAPDDTTRRTLLHAHVIEIVRDILNAPGQHITPTTSMVMLGLDSLAAMQLRQRLQRSLDLSIDTAVLWLKPTAAGLTDWILQQMGYEVGEPTVSASAPGLGHWLQGNRP